MRVEPKERLRGTLITRLFVKSIIHLGTSINKPSLNLPGSFSRCTGRALYLLILLATVDVLKFSLARSEYGLSLKGAIFLFQSYKE